MNRMTPLAWTAAVTVMACGAVMLTLPAIDVWLVKNGHTSLTDHLRAFGASRPWFMPVSVAAIFGSVNAVAGMVVGHLWLQ